jgi:glutamate racemase
MIIPKYVLENSKCTTSREWKSKKREQARAARKAIDTLRAGCAHFPSGADDLEEAAQAIDRICADISVENWGR